MRERLSSYKVPTIVRIVAAADLPVTASTKVDRRGLLKLLHEGPRVSTRAALKPPALVPRAGASSVGSSALALEDFHGVVVGDVSGVAGPFETQGECRYFPGVVDAAVLFVVDAEDLQRVSASGQAVEQVPGAANDIQPIVACYIIVSREAWLWLR